MTIRQSTYISEQTKLSKLMKVIFDHDKGVINQEDITILNVYVSNNRASN